MGEITQDSYVSDRPRAAKRRALMASALGVVILAGATGCGVSAPSGVDTPGTASASPSPSAPSVFLVPEAPEFGLHAVILEDSVETAATPGLAEEAFGHLGLPRSEANEALFDQFVNRDCDVILPASAEIAVACDTEGELVYLLVPASVTMEQISAVEAVDSRSLSPQSPDQLMLTLTDQAAADIILIPGSGWQFNEGVHRIAAVVDGVVIAKPTYTEELDGATVIYLEARPPWHPAAMVRAFGETAE